MPLLLLPLLKTLVLQSFWNVLVDEFSYFQNWSCSSLSSILFYVFAVISAGKLVLH